MSWPKVILARLRGLLKRDQLERQMEDELRFHLEMQIEDNVRMGMRPEEARYTARRKFGAIESMKEEYRASSRFLWIDGVVQDCYYAIRVMLRSPAAILTTVATLAIGIGVNTAVFTAYKAMVARPLDALDPYEMVNLALDRGLGAIHFSFSYPDYETIRDSAHSFSGVVAYHPGRVTYADSSARSGIGKPESVAAGVVSENYFQVRSQSHPRTNLRIHGSRRVGRHAVCFDQRKLLAGAVFRRSQDPREDGVPQWGRGQYCRDYAPRLRRY